MLYLKTKKMDKYKFIKPFEKTVTVGGVVGIMKKSFVVGQVVDGLKKDSGIEIRIASHSSLNEGSPSNASYQEVILVPNEYLELDNSSSSVKSSSKEKSDSYFTTKNVVIGLVLIGSIYGLLKITKVIK